MVISLIENLKVTDRFVSTTIVCPAFQPIILKSQVLFLEKDRGGAFSFPPEAGE
jgi:hypothetical protein